MTSSQYMHQKQTSKAKKIQEFLSRHRIAWPLEVKRKANVSVSPKAVVLVLDDRLCHEVLAPFGRRVDLSTLQSLPSMPWCCHLGRGARDKP